MNFFHTQIFNLEIIQITLTEDLLHRKTLSNIKCRKRYLNLVRSRAAYNKKNKKQKTAQPSDHQKGKEH